MHIIKSLLPLTKWTRFIILPVKLLVHSVFQLISNIGKFIKLKIITQSQKINFVITILWLLQSRRRRFGCCRHPVPQYLDSRFSTIPHFRARGGQWSRRTLEWRVLQPSLKSSESGFQQPQHHARLEFPLGAIDRGSSLSKQKPKIDSLW